MRLLNQVLSSSLLVGALQLVPWFSAGCQAQYWPNHMWDNWYFGNGGGLQFNGTLCTPLLGNPNTVETAGGAVTGSSPVTGEIMLISSGGLWSGNGNSLIGHDAWMNMVGNQQLLILRPGSQTDWFWIIEYPDTINFTGYYLKALEIDAAANGGNGAILSGAIEFGQTGGRRMVAIPSMSNDTIWLLLDHRADSAYYAFPITSAGIGNVQLAGPLIPSTNEVDFRPTKASRQGDKIASMGLDVDHVLLQYFDRNTGQTSDPINLTLDLHGAFTSFSDLEFSPDGQLLYVSQALTGSGPFHIWQFNLSAWDSLSIQGSRVSIEADSTLWTSAMQLAPNDQIYTWTGAEDSTALSVIMFPNVIGPACGHSLYSVPLPQGVSLHDVHENRMNLWWPSSLPDMGINSLTGSDRCLKAFPNPAENGFNVTLSSRYDRNGTCSVIWYDASGRMVRSDQVPVSPEIRLTRNELPSGYYQLRITTADGGTAHVTVGFP
jgi:hypothetical protein